MKDETMAGYYQLLIAIFCKQFLIQMISIIEEEDTEIRAKREELEKAA